MKARDVTPERVVSCVMSDVDAGGDADAGGEYINPAPVVRAKRIARANASRALQEARETARDAIDAEETKSLVYEALLQMVIKNM